jgi:hypothetical protein
MEFQIREMKEADWEQVGKIYKQGMDSNLATFQTELPTYEEWDKGHLNICRLVAVKNDKIIGWAALLPTSSRKAVTIDLWDCWNNTGRDLRTTLPPSRHPKRNRATICRDELTRWTSFNSIHPVSATTVATHLLHS